MQTTTELLACIAKNEADKDALIAKLMSEKAELETENAELRAKLARSESEPRELRFSMNLKKGVLIQNPARGTKRIKPELRMVMWIAPKPVAEPVAEPVVEVEANELGLGERILYLVRLYPGSTSKEIWKKSNYDIGENTYPGFRARCSQLRDSGKLDGVLTGRAYRYYCVQQ